MKRIVYEAVSDVGCKRANNEDMALADGRLLRDASAVGELAFGQDTRAAFAVADGMGGYEGGEIASEIALRSLMEYIRTVPAGLDGDGLVLSLKDWATEANRTLLAVALSNPRLSEMGTTLVALIVYEGKVATVHIGDSRLYRFRGGVLKQLTTDHSERELTGNPQVPSNLIYNFLGNDGAFFADVVLWDGQVLPGDCFLLCSDGLSDLLDDDEISEVLDSAEPVAAGLVRRAKEAGGRDNVTVLVLRVADGPETGQQDGLLALAYYEGQGVERDCEKAFFHAKRGMEAGDGAACYVLGLMCANGDTPDQRTGGERQEYDHYDAEHFMELATKTEGRWAVEAHRWLGDYFMDSCRGDDPDEGLAHYRAADRKVKARTV